MARGVTTMGGRESGELVVGVDIATEEARAACVDGDGQVVATAGAPGPRPHSPRPGWSEQDAGEWWPAVVSALRRITDELGRRRRDVVALSVAATSGSVLLADDEGRPVGPALLYDDRRAEEEASRAQEAGRDRWDSLGLRVSPSFGLPKWAWLCSHVDASRARHAWHLSDLVVNRLISECPPTDWSHALKSGYDPLWREWAEEAIEAVGVPTGLLPEVLPPTAPAGRVGSEAAESTGIPAGAEVRLGMTDGCAGQVAAGAVDPGRFVSVLGTTLVVKGASRELLRDPAGAAYSHRHPDGWWLPGGASNTGGRCLREWFGEADLGDLDRRAEAHGPAGCIVYPLVGTGERFPLLEPEAECFWLGSPQSDVERYRATLEGVAFVERLALGHLAALGAPVEPPVAVAGAGSRSRVWNAVRATVLGVPLVVRHDADTAFGAAVLAAAGTLHGGLNAASQAMVADGERVDPVAGEREALDRSYRRFVDGLVERGWIGPEAAEWSTTIEG